MKESNGLRQNGEVLMSTEEVIDKIAALMRNNSTIESSGFPLNIRGQLRDAIVSLLAVEAIRSEDDLNEDYTATNIEAVPALRDTVFQQLLDAVPEEEEQEPTEVSRHIIIGVGDAESDAKMTSAPPAEFYDTRPDNKEFTIEIADCSERWNHARMLFFAQVTHNMEFIDCLREMFDHSFVIREASKPSMYVIEGDKMDGGRFKYYVPNLDSLQRDTHRVQQNAVALLGFFEFKGEPRWETAKMIKPYSSAERFKKGEIAFA